MVHDPVDPPAAGMVTSWKTSLRRANSRSGGHHQALALVDLRDEAEEQVRPGLVEQDVPELVEEDRVVAGELLHLPD